MKLEIWGSGGGEGYPAFFCNCDHCVQARKAGGKSIRSLHQSCIDGNIVIDLPMDTNMHLLRHNRSLYDVEHILITHVHADHFVPQFLDTRGDCFAHNIKHEKLKIYGSSKVKAFFDGVFGVYFINPVIRGNIEFPVIENFETFTAGKYQITPLPAKHSPELKSLNYLIEDGKTSLLYLIDSGYPDAETLDFLQNRQIKLGCVVMDGTMGEREVGAYCYHMGFEENKLLRAELLKRGMIDENTPVVVTHITHNSTRTHDTVEAIFEGSGITPAYDGFAIEF